jgi:putative heme-binding domain-containing protein
MPHLATMSVTIRAACGLAAAFALAACKHEGPHAIAQPVLTQSVATQPAPTALPDPTSAVPVTPPSPPVRTAAQLRKAKMLAEVVLRLKGADLSADADTKAMVDKALAANQGTPTFVEITEAFALKDRDADLLQIAIEHPAESVAALAMRLVLANSGTEAVQKALEGRDAAAIAQVLGNANDQRALGLLLPIVQDNARDLSLRQESVRALGQFESGTMEILALYQNKALPSELQAVAAGVLAKAPWDNVRAEVQRALPPPAAADAKLPPIPELATRTGDAAHGEVIFGSLCVACHQVAGRGIDYGPNLSAIGNKLGKDGLYLAILYPDAGVEFNFETTLLGLRDGNSAIGIVQSDTDQEVAIKSIGGTVSRYRTADIVRRTKQKSSSMPTGLQSGLRQQDLIDLVEYLAGLRGQ